MSYEELKIALELCLDRKDRINVLSKNCGTNNTFGYFFVDDDNGKCYLFDENGNEDDIRKIKVLEKDYVRKDVKKIIVPDSVTSIGDRAFRYCQSLTSINIPNSMTRIESGTFAYCENLTSITIPNRVTSIGDGAFRDCTSLISITIPNGVETIGYEAFYDCLNLKNMTFEGKTFEQVKAIDYYPWGIEDEYPWRIEDESIIHCC